MLLRGLHTCRSLLRMFCFTAKLSDMHMAQLNSLCVCFAGTQFPTLCGRTWVVLRLL